MSVATFLTSCRTPRVGPQKTISSVTNSLVRRPCRRVKAMLRRTGGRRSIGVRLRPVGSTRYLYGLPTGGAPLIGDHYTSQKQRSRPQMTRTIVSQVRNEAAETIDLTSSRLRLRVAMIETTVERGRRHSKKTAAHSTAVVRAVPLGLAPGMVWTVAVSPVVADEWLRSRAQLAYDNKHYFAQLLARRPMVKRAKHRDIAAPRVS